MAQQFINIMIIETFIVIILFLYCVYLNLRIKGLENDSNDTEDILFCEINELIQTNKVNEERFKALEKKKVAKPRGRSTKKRSKVSADKVS